MASEPRRCPVCRARTHSRHASFSGKDDQTDVTTADSDPSAPVVIFLSYRRDDVPFAVGLLAARLFEAFPPGDVFLDTMANRRGLFVRRQIRQALASSAVVVSVIGPVWDDERHLSRLADDDDLVRWELETALEQHLPIVPVLVDRDQELSEELPGRLMALHEFAPKALRRETFLGDADALVHHLVGILGNQAGAREPQLQHALAPAPSATLDAAIVRRGIDAMLRHVLPLPQQSTRNLEHLVAATASLLEAGEWLHYAATGHLPGKPSGSALVVVTDQAVRIAQLGGNLKVKERWQSPIGEVLGADLVERRRLRMLDVADVTFRVSGRTLPSVEAIFGDQAVRLTQLATPHHVDVRKKR
jgi:TIR domain-containing protein